MNRQPKPLCRWCALRPVKADGLCATDYEYRRRTGRMRPSKLVVAHAERLVERDVEERMRLTS